MKNVNENNPDVNTNTEENYTPNAKPFAFGQLVVTRGIADMMQEKAIFDGALVALLFRHATGDWATSAPKTRKPTTKPRTTGNVYFLLISLAVRKFGSSPNGIAA